MDTEPYLDTEAELIKAADRIVEIFSHTPYGLYGKSNPLINWGHDPVDYDVRLSDLARAIGTDNSVYDFYFEPNKIFEGKGFDTLCAINHGRADADYVAHSPETYLKSTQQTAPIDIHKQITIPKDYNDHGRDIFVYDAKGGFFGYGWMQNYQSIGDGRPMRNIVWGVCANGQEHKELIELVKRGTQISPGFMYEKVLPRLFPQAFQPDVTLALNTLETLFDPETKRKLAKYLVDKNLSVEKLPLFRPISQTKADTMPQTKQSKSWKERFFGKEQQTETPSQSVQVTEVETKDRIIAAIKEKLYGKYARLLEIVIAQLDNEGKNEFTKTELQDFLNVLPHVIHDLIMADPNVYIDAFTSKATAQRRVQCTMIEFIDISKK